jgi:hypothetical protein
MNAFSDQVDDIPIVVVENHRGSGSRHGIPFENR